MSEYVQFAGARILLVGILVGSYSFVLTAPSALENEPWSGRERGWMKMRFRDGGK